MDPVDKIVFRPNMKPRMSFQHYTPNDGILSSKSCGPGPMCLPLRLSIARQRRVYVVPRGLADGLQNRSSDMVNVLLFFFEIPYSHIMTEVEDSSLV